MLGDEKAFADTASAIEQARERLQDWTDIPSDWQSLGKGVKRVLWPRAEGIRSGEKRRLQWRTFMNGASTRKYLCIRL